MAKKTYIGVAGVARKVKKQYIGVANLARKIKKIYIGVAGVARCIFSGGELVYYGTITPLSAARSSISGARAGTYATFVGGFDGSNCTGVIDAYSSILIRSTLSSITPSYNFATASAGDAYALYISGSTSVTYSYVSISISAALVRSSVPAPQTYIEGMTGNSIGIYALFAGGGYATSYYTTIHAYSNTLVRTTIGNLNYDQVAGSGGGKTGNGQTAIFAGGSGSEGYLANYSTAISSALVVSSLTGLSQPRNDAASATAGDFYLCAGGRTSYSSYRATVDAYNSALVRTTVTSLSSSRVSVGLSIGDYALFGAGQLKSGITDIVDIYDAALVRTTMSMSTTRGYHAGVSIGNYGLFAGGLDASNTDVSSVDVFTAV